MSEHLPVVTGCQLPTWRPQDRRRAPRYPSSAEIAYTVANNSSPGRVARVFDISDSGIGLLLGQALERGTLLTLEFPATEGSPSHVICARVAHATEQSEGNYLIGCVLQSELTADVVHALANRSTAH